MSNAQIILIKKYLKKKHERIILEIIIKDYNNSNFYIALVFNKKIEKFKIVYVPLDIMTKNVDDYICYQFININEVNYIIQTIYNAKEEYINDDVRDKLNKNVTNYYIEINTNIKDECFSFKTTRYIPKEWLFMFDSIVIIFEHLPNIMSELCNDILAVLTNSEELINYKTSINFDLFNDDLNTLFNKVNVKKGNAFYENNQVKYLELIEGKYYAIVKDHIVIIEYNKKSKTLSAFCDCSCHIHGKHVYAAIKAIRNNKFNNFSKIAILIKKNDLTTAKYYLCYGLDSEYLKIISSSEEENIPLTLFKEGLLKIVEDNNDLETKIKRILKLDQN